ncbi:probable receptor-like protein kinase At5g24010 [Arachis stenosperma]|uniref:probable receptor-like protein kinase At5g24010 n=1 Tax=Arachis stenosperma TaxID=217475 RepID=UPI0025AC7E11|nr:probable receptor-like protein kinase At5g24010 [Arachis stenosperma]
MIVAEIVHHTHQFSMAIHHQFYTVQHSLPLLLLLVIQLSSLQFHSHGYDLQNKYFINCGSSSNAKDTESGKTYVGDSSQVSYSKGSKTESNQSSVPSPIYQSARIFPSQSFYEFPIDTAGTYIIRLHFLAFTSPSNLSSATFNVSVPNFMLLQNFTPKNYTKSPLVKEYYVKISLGKFRIIFDPLRFSFAFVNAIEVFLLPRFLIANSVTGFDPQPAIGQNSLSTYSGVLTRALETKHRLNVGGNNITSSADLLWRTWFLDDTYLIDGQNAKSSQYSGSIPLTAGPDDDGPNANSYTAPENDVYGTARWINVTSENITWSLPVDKNVNHLIRLHFCDIWSIQADLTIFGMYIYDQFALLIGDDRNVSNKLPAPYYYDLMVQSDNSGFFRITVKPNSSAKVLRAFLNGLEIMRMVDSSDLSYLEDHSNGNTSVLRVVLGSVLGGLVLVALVVIVLVWRLKTDKQKPVEGSDWLPIPATAGGSSHSRTSRLTDGTIQGSPLRNINLGLKVPLQDLQLATKNFDEKQIIGKGGFGNVYKGVLKNGMKVAVKRSEPGSGQGLPEFQTEIMVLSKIRHRHLVSLIGYCDERYEMILVYEYMDKGTLRDHLYNTKLPSLTWKQRLEICIGAARGLQYLHKGASGGIIHRDVKSTNILLDENLVAKVADFGLSRTGPLDQHSYVSTGVKGTFGYLDPEYFRSQQLTEKSDVYSFGVVLLEVLCARPAIEPSLPREQVNLAEWGILCKNKGILEDIIDPTIKGQLDQNSFRKFSETIEKCLQEDGSDRPTMGDVLWDLEYALQLQRGAIHREPHEDSSSSASASLQLPNVRRLPSLSTLSEVDDMSIAMGDRSDTADDSVFSQLKIDEAR